MIPLRQSTASQTIQLGGIFVKSSDGDTEETALTIANTDIKLHKFGATSLVNKNSGGGTHMSNGRYYATFDATDTNTVGPLTITVHVSGALVETIHCYVFEEAVYDALYASGATGLLPANVTQISGDSTAADNAESFFDGTGYAGTNNIIPSVTTVTGNVNGSVGSVTGNVGGNVTGTVASVVGAVGSVTGNVGGNVVGSTASVTQGVTLASSEDIYHALIEYTYDDPVDEYTVTWFKNGAAVTSGITVPKIQVVKRADGTDLVAATAMTQIGSTGSYKYDESSDVLVADEAYLAIATATIDSGSRDYRCLISRSS